jgi:hypothetical protein
MEGSLQTNGWSIASPFRSIVIIAITAGWILAIDCADGETPPTWTRQPRRRLPGAVPAMATRGMLRHQTARPD